MHKGRRAATEGPGNKSVQSKTLGDYCRSPPVLQLMVVMPNNGHELSVREFVNATTCLIPPDRPLPRTAHLQGSLLPSVPKRLPRTSLRTQHATGKPNCLLKHALALKIPCLEHGSVDLSELLRSKKKGCLSGVCTHAWDTGLLQVMPWLRHESAGPLGLLEDKLNLLSISLCTIMIAIGCHLGRST